MARLLLLLVLAALLIGLPPFLDLGLQNAMNSMLIASLFAVAFNLLSGQAGLLSFGHAAYFGVGAFAVLHLMRLVDNGVIDIPTPLLPLAGGLVSLLVGAFFGYFASFRSGVYFALVTLAIAELLHSLAPHWLGVFGGEAGLSSMRLPWAGLTYGSTLEVYYTTLVWVVVSISLLWYYTRTPLGRLTLALRDNEQRVRFLGYNAHTTKVVVFAVSAGFSGIAGGLLAFSNEVANYAIFSTQVSAQVVLHTFIGGSTIFFGPVIGASVLTLFAFLMSEATRSWLLYQGIVFVLVMLFAPHGLGGAIAAELKRDAGALRRRLPAYALLLASLALLAAGTVFVVEALAVLFSDGYAVARRNAEGALPPFRLFGTSWEPLGPLTFAVPLGLFLLGGLLLPMAHRRFAAVEPPAEEGRTTPAAARGGAA